jgi:hypothetical protein
MGVLKKEHDEELSRGNIVFMVDPYKSALLQARQDLTAAAQEAKRLTLRVAQLEAVVAQLEALISSSPPSPVPLFEAASISVPERKVNAVPKDTPATPLWKAIVAALNGKKGDFTVPDALAALERNGRHVESPNRKNIVRNTLKQREDIFAKIGVGRFCVKGYEGQVHEEEEKKNFDF